MTTLVKVSIDMDLRSQQFTMRSQAPTVVLLAVLDAAADLARGLGDQEIVENIQGTDPRKPRVIELEYDLADEKFKKVRTDCSPIIFRGIVLYAVSSIGSNQTMQRIQTLAARRALQNTTMPKGRKS